MLVQLRTGFRDLPEYLQAIDAVPGTAFVKNLSVTVPRAHGDTENEPDAGSDLEVRVTVTTYAYREPVTAPGGPP